MPETADNSRVRVLSIRGERIASWLSRISDPILLRATREDALERLFAEVRADTRVRCRQDLCDLASAIRRTLGTTGLAWQWLEHAGWWHESAENLPSRPVVASYEHERMRRRVATVLTDLAAGRPPDGRDPHDAQAPSPTWHDLDAEW